MKNCIFCKIARKEIPCNVVYEDKDSLAFLDISPSNLGHTLVVPKKHFDDVGKMSPDDLSKLSNAIVKISRGILKIADGMNIGQNNGRVAGQLVNHVHFHLIPRYIGDDLKLTWHAKKFSEEEINGFLKKIKKYLR